LRNWGGGDGVMASRHEREAGLLGRRGRERLFFQGRDPTRREGECGGVAADHPLMGSLWFVPLV